MKNIFKIKIHFFFYIIFILSILTGNFKIFITLTLITFFHELGHIIMGIIFKWKIEKVIILPVSLQTIFNTKINNNKYEEILVTIMGPVFQTILFLIIKDKEILRYNLMILLFNLLPIVPLDGFKLLKIIFYEIFPFIIVEYMSIVISFLTLISLIILSKFNLIIILICVIFSFKTIKELENTKYIYNKFLFERYLYNPRFSKTKNIKNRRYLYKNHNNTFFSQKYIINEQEIFSKMFDNIKLL